MSRDLEKARSKSVRFFLLVGKDRKLEWPRNRALTKLKVILLSTAFKIFKIFSFPFAFYFYCVCIPVFTLLSTGNKHESRSAWPHVTRRHISALCPGLLSRTCHLTSLCLFFIPKVRGLDNIRGSPRASLHSPAS